VSAAQSPRILIDLDGTVVDWEAAFESTLLSLHPAATLRDAATYDAVARWDAPKGIVLDVINRALDYSRMKAKAGAVEAIAEMKAAGLDVWICSKNTAPNYFCASDKIGWVKKRLGADFAERTILIHDKTLVHGDILIDDRADISIGAMTPSWTHVVFDAEYNREMDANVPRLTNWAEWREVLGGVLDIDLSAKTAKAVAA
jgi:5'-nucleotidase